MGQMKSYLMELEQAFEILYSIDLKLNSPEYFKNIQYLDFDQYRNFIKLLITNAEARNVDVNYRLIKFIHEYIEPIAEELNKFNDYKNRDTQIVYLFARFQKAMQEYRRIVTDFEEKRRPINSEEYYNKKIEEFKRREQDLIDILNEKTGQSEQDISRANEEIEKAGCCFD